MNAIAVLIVDDQALVRRGLRRLLELENEVNVVGEAADGNEAIELINQGLAVDVALIDARMPGMDGITLITRLKVEHPDISTLLLTTFDEDELIFGALCAGAGGFLLKDAEPDDLLAAIRSVRARTLVIDDNVAPRVIARLSAQPTPEDHAPLPTDEMGSAPAPSVRPGESPLTAREYEVAQMVAQGATNQEIADALVLSHGTVKNHISAILRKMGLRDRTQLAIALRD